MDKLTLFTYAEGNLLVRLCIAHLLADFVLQSKKMAKQKNWNNRYLYLHVGIVALTVLGITGSLKLALGIGLMHGLIDVGKAMLASKYTERKSLLFFTDQLMHAGSLLLAWALYAGIGTRLLSAVKQVLTSYEISLITLGYLLVMWPTGYALRFALKDIAPSNNPNRENIEKGGNLIGMFERVIILTFMLLGAYGSIGFLITGKSIIRFAQTEEKLRSEYVLLGTMMSYGVAIITGAVLNFLCISTP